jgi:hypothetical protein
MLIEAFAAIFISPVSTQVEAPPRTETVTAYSAAASESRLQFDQISTAHRAMGVFQSSAGC